MVAGATTCRSAWFSTGCAASFGANVRCAAPRLASRPVRARIAEYGRVLTACATCRSPGMERRFGADGCSVGVIRYSRVTRHSGLARTAPNDGSALGTERPPSSSMAAPSGPLSARPRRQLRDRTRREPVIGESWTVADKGIWPVMNLRPDDGQPATGSNRGHVVVRNATMARTDSSPTMRPAAVGRRRRDGVRR